MRGDPTPRHALTQAGGLERLSRTLGEDATTFVTVARTASGGTKILFPAEQNPLEGLKLLEDAAHRLRCGGQCAACHPDS